MELWMRNGVSWLQLSNIFKGDCNNDFQRYRHLFEIVYSRGKLEMTFNNRRLCLQKCLAHNQQTQGLGCAELRTLAHIVSPGDRNRHSSKICWPQYLKLSSSKAVLVRISTILKANIHWALATCQTQHRALHLHNLFNPQNPTSGYYYHPFLMCWGLASAVTWPRSQVQYVTEPVFGSLFV